VEAVACPVGTGLLAQGLKDEGGEGRSKRESQAGAKSRGPTHASSIACIML